MTHENNKGYICIPSMSTAFFQESKDERCFISEYHPTKFKRLHKQNKCILLYKFLGTIRYSSNAWNEKEYQHRSDEMQTSKMINASSHGPCQAIRTNILSLF